MALADAEDVVVLEAYLRPDAPVQTAFLHRTIREGRSLAVPGADVRVIGPGGVVHGFAPVADSMCVAGDTTPSADELGSCYGSSGGWVLPGATYDLEAVLADGRELRGRTTVPADFSIVRPAADTCAIGALSYELVWTRSEGAWVYLAEARLAGLADGLRERGVVDPPDTLDLLGLSISSADTTMVLPTEFGVFDRFDLDRDLLIALQQGLPPGATADVVVGAAERNYVNWIRGGSFNPSGQVRIPSVTGEGTGVFGAVVIKRRTFVTDAESGSPGCG